MTRMEINKLDEAWAKAIKTRAGWKCEHCGKSDWVEAAHIAGRQYRFCRWGSVINERWDPCGHCLCHRCHLEYDSHGPQEPNIVDQTIGKERKYRIQLAASCLGSVQDFKTIMTILEAYRNGRK